MYLHSIELENIKGFKKLAFNFDRGGGTYAGWTVLTGGNGSGKSTLLQSIAMSLTGVDATRALKRSFENWIHKDFNAGFIKNTLVPATSDDGLTGQGRGLAGNSFISKLEFKNTERHIEIKNKSPKDYPARGPWSMDAQGWFTCGYGPFRRILGSSPEAMRDMIDPITNRFVTMFQEAASLSEADTWLCSLYVKTLEERAKEKAVLDQVLAFIKDDFLPSGMEFERIDSDGVWIRDANNVALSWRDMSDGYRSALALLLDIFRHLVNTYGVNNLCEKNDAGKLFVNRSGVVLIDEIDAHLHPSWQQQIGFWLKSRMPNIQFIVTSHSPLVLQAADSNGIFVLPDSINGVEARALNDQEYREIIASKSDTILTSHAFDLLHTRSDYAMQMRQQHDELISKVNAGIALSDDEEKLLVDLEPFTHD